MVQECCHCKKTDGDVVLHKCPICFKHFCDDHAARTSGVSFCSGGCGDYFFHAEPDKGD